MADIPKAAGESGIPLSAPADRPLYVGSKMIPAGETRIFDPADVPPHLRPKTPQAPAAAPPDPVLALLDKPVADIRRALPGIEDEDLARLKVAEEAGKTRKSLMGAIAEEELRRAEARADGTEENEDQDED